METSPDIMFHALKSSVFTALETYSNVHRGSGQFSQVTTRLFEQAREIVLKYLGLGKRYYVVIFCTPRRAAEFTAGVEPGSYRILSSRDIGLAIGVSAVAIRKNALPKGDPLESGGGTARLISRDWVIWADAPDKFEAGTPAIINVITFASALSLLRKAETGEILVTAQEPLTAERIFYEDEFVNDPPGVLLEKLRALLIGKNIAVPTARGEKPFVNLDNAASTRTFLPVWKAFCQGLQPPELIRQDIINEARLICSKFLGAPLSSYEIIFTSNTTEAINLVARSFGKEKINHPERVVINTILEHTSNDLPFRSIPGCSLDRLNISKDGMIDIIQLETLLKNHSRMKSEGGERAVLVSVCGASNVLGISNNLGEISEIVHRYGAHFLVDAAQLVAHRRVSMDQEGIDILAFSAHKIYAPFGTGVLAVRKGLMNFSAEQKQLILDSAEENVAGIAALGKSLVLMQRIGLDLIREEEQAMTAKALRAMAQVPGLTLYGVSDPASEPFSRKVGVIGFTMKKMMSNVIARKLAEQEGIGIRYGCHCAHVLVKHVLGVGPGLEKFQRFMVRMLPGMKLPGMARVSLGLENSNEDIERLIQALNRMANSPMTSVNKRNLKKARILMGQYTGEISRKVYIL